MGRPRKASKPTLVNGRLLCGPAAAAVKAAEQASAAGRPDEARRLFARLEARLAEADDTAWRAAAAAETAALEEARGGRLERAEGGRFRIRNRDGLDSLRAAGAIDDRQAAAGLRYRARFEAARQALPSALAIRPGGVRSGRRERPDGLAARLAEARCDVERMEAAVVARCADRRAAAEAVTVLREVAGEGRTLRELATSGHRRDRLRTRLVGALEAVREVLY